MNWIVLGHTGFLGRELMRVLPGAQGFSRSTVDLRKLETFAALDRVATPDSVVVMVSGLTPEHCKNVDGFSDNIAMAANVARWVEGHPIGRLVFVSTDGLYPMIDRAVTEDTPAAPDNFYAISKYAAERLLEAVCRSKNLPLLIARPSGIYGPGDSHNAYGPNRFVRSIVAEKSVKLFGEGEERRDHIHVNDAARLIVRLVEARASGTYNLVTGTAVSFGEVAAILKEVSPVPFTVVSQARKGPITHRWYDVSRLRAACPGFEFTDLRKGLAALVEGK